MLTPGQLNLIEDLVDGATDELAPEIDADTNRVVYPGAADHLEDPVSPALDTLVDVGVLERSASRDCTIVFSDPHETVEVAFDTFEATDDADEWLEARLAARQATADLLERRGFDVAVDTTLTGDSGAEYPLHVHAEDAVLGLEMALGIAEGVTREDVISLCGIAVDTDARPLCLSMTDVDEGVRDFAARHGVVVVRADEGAPAEGAIDAVAETVEAED